MSAGEAVSTTSNEDWFAEWFGEEYLELYPHRDEGEASLAVDLVVRSSGIAPGETVLDLACGAGRHVAHLRAKGLRAFGLDLSLPLLRRARQHGLPVVRGDMRRVPVASQSLAMVTSFFTSFGYFPEPADDRRVLAEVHRILRKGGVFFVDYLNADRVRASLRPLDEEEVNGRRVVQTRTLVDDDHVVEKRISIYSPEGGPPRVFHERVRLYSAAELTAMLEEQGIAVTHVFGDYGGEPASAAAPRLILMGTSR